ncbi:MAG: carbohydrate binding family 9 domain-containing protein [Bacteroidota bacterium]|nr:carbohydrate binding family 9 domain-containing protein [Bacteroidota bacterium]
MRCFFLFALFITFYSSQAQEKKQLQAIRVIQSPKLDGILDEDVWQNIPVATDFIQNQLKPGTPSSQKSEVKLIYDDNALYVGAILYDVSKDSILRELGKRDSEGNTDIFGIIIDTYKDGINAFGFFITPSGVQIDARYSANGQDFEWNAVWESKVQINDNSWVVEFKIPYSALRFSKNEVQTWGVNFIRKIRRHREMSFWNDINPAIDGFVNQFGVLHGVEKIVSPVRLSLTPYVSGYADHFQNETGSFTRTTFNAGADIKYGINESFTLDMTLVPDFGQVQSDNLVLNLSPFEIQFNDFRPFFTEGTELFNRGGLFYTRRVGGEPIDYYSVSNQVKPGEKLISNPSNSQMINATKISGRTSSGLGIGVFNGTTANAYATIEDSEGQLRNILTDPLTNYSVIVFDQSLKNNSYVSMFNTNVMREGSFYDANVTGAQFRLMDKSITYALSGNTNLSQKYNSGITNPETGHAYFIDFSKISGNYQYYFNHGLKSNTYDPNDLGFLLINNQVTYSSGIRYNIFKPFWKLNNLYTNLGFYYAQLYQPNVFQDFNIHGSVRTTFTKKFLSTGMDFKVEPVKTYDYFEPRTPGRFYLFPENIHGGYWISSDYRKRLALDVNMAANKLNEPGRINYNYGISPRFRANNKLFFLYNYNYENRVNDVGYVSKFEEDVFFGIRNVNTIINTLTTSYTFTNRMSLSIRGRHYWSKAIYKEYKLLSLDGTLEDVIYNQDHNVNFNAFNIDLVYIWNFAPGSEMTIVWKNAIINRENETQMNYYNNFKNTIESPQVNSLSIKLLYYLDYLTLRSGVKR